MARMHGIRLSSFARPAPAPFAAALGFVLGTALQLQQATLGPCWQVLAGLLLALALLAGLRRCGERRWRTLAVGLAWALLALALTELRSQWQMRLALAPALEGRDVRLSGIVSDLPQATAQGLRWRMQVESARLEPPPGSDPVAVDAGEAAALARLQRVDVAWYAPAPEPGLPVTTGLPDLRAGERWEFTVRLRAPHGNANPHGFDYELWLWEQGVQATASVRAGARVAPPRRLGNSARALVARARQWVRERIFVQLAGPAETPSAAAGVVAALVVGDQSAIAPADWTTFRATGVAHLMSISGLHVTMFAWVASTCLGWGWRRSAALCQAVPAPAAALWGGVMLATAYAVFSGWGLPAQRTCVMLACVALLRLAGLCWPWPQVWMLACAAVAAFDPWALLQAGFWLSFVAVAVLFATEARPLPARGGALWQRLLHGGGRHLWRQLREQWLLTLALAPLTALWFGQVSLVGLLANLWAIPWLTLLVTPLAMLGVLWPALWTVAESCVTPGLEWLQAMAAWPGATLRLPALPGWVVLSSLLGSALLVLALPWPLRLAGLALLLPALLWQVPRPAPGQFELLAADVGQGNAVLVRTASHALLYDAGPRHGPTSDAGQRVLLPLLQALQVRLDLLVLSHRDADHAGGAAAVLADQPQARLLSSLESGHPLQALRPLERCSAGQHWEWDGVQFDILHPAPADYARGAKPNAVSCVLRIQAPGAAGQPVRVLLAGDIEKAQEAQLLAQPETLAADLLLVPHHGSRTSSSAAFLDAVRPRIALVQAGYRNRYGHPQVQVMQRYRERHVAVHDSPHCGAMMWHSQRPGVIFCARQERRRYWHHRVP